MADNARTRAVREEYTRIARSYDRRWARYTATTTRETLSRLALQPGNRLLDLGCGTGELILQIHRLYPEVRIIGADLALAMLFEAGEKLPGVAALVAADAVRLPFAAGAFDVVVSSSSFHYWPSPEAGLTEIRRVLGAGGRLVITDWCDDYLACRVADVVLRLIDPAHHRTYGTRTCGRLLRDAGFQEVRVERFRVGWPWGMMAARGLTPYRLVR